jgi:hypothetical protein
MPYQFFIGVVQIFKLPKFKKPNETQIREILLVSGFISVLIGGIAIYWPGALVLGGLYLMFKSGLLF